MDSREDDCVFIPSLEHISTEAAKIRARWTDDEILLRRTGLTPRQFAEARQWQPPTARVAMEFVEFAE